MLRLLVPFVTAAVVGAGAALSRGAAPTTATTTTTTPVANPPRGRCERCGRPSVVCVCAALPAAPLATRTEVLVLQHPNEAKRNPVKCTVPLMALCLARVEVVRGEAFDQQALVHDAVRRGLRPKLLYPGGVALTEPPEDALLIVLDGTWDEAKRILRNSPTLLDVADLVSVNRPKNLFGAVRRQPSDGSGTSTLEACAAALRALEPTPEAADALDCVVQLAVDHQLRSRWTCLAREKKEEEESSDDGRDREPP